MPQFNAAAGMLVRFIKLSLCFDGSEIKIQSLLGFPFRRFYRHFGDCQFFYFYFADKFYNLFHWKFVSIDRIHRA